MLLGRFGKLNNEMEPFRRNKNDTPPEPDKPYLSLNTSRIWLKPENNFRGNIQVASNTDWEIS